MKTISGKLVSVQSISLSKASRYISDFASFENNGVSEVVSIYLSRASEAFCSLVQMQKELKRPESSRRKDRRKSCSGELDGVIEDMVTSKKKLKVMHEEGDFKMEDGVSGDLRKGSGNGGGVEGENVVNGFVDQPKKKKKNGKSRESATEEVSVAGERLGVENGVKKGKDEEKKVKRRKGNEIKEERKEVEMEVEQGKKNRKKRKGGD